MADGQTVADGGGGDEQSALHSMPAVDTQISCHLPAIG
jgi:hypothetical protein